jgi:hypothetical protein
MSLKRFMSFVFIFRFVVDNSLQIDKWKKGVEQARIEATTSYSRALEFIYLYLSSRNAS